MIAILKTILLASVWKKIFWSALFYVVSKNKDLLFWAATELIARMDSKDVYKLLLTLRRK